MWLISIYILVGLITFFVWGFDKYRAKTQQWRVPERWLFTLTLLGGSFGALAGMTVFHHKTRKLPFRIVVGVSILVHTLLLFSLQNKFWSKTHTQEAAHMSELKTKPTDVPVDDFLNSLEDAKRREECRVLSQMMEKATGAEGVMWGENIVGFGQYRYKYASGRGGDWPLVGYSPRKQNLTLYLMSGFAEYEDILKRLGKFKTSVSCLYIKKLTDIDQASLQELIDKSVEHMLRIYPPAAG